MEMSGKRNIGKDTAWGKGAIKLWSVSILLLLGAAVLAYFWWFDRVKAGEPPETKHLLVPKKLAPRHFKWVSQSVAYPR